MGNFRNVWRISVYVQRNGYETFNRYQTAWGGSGFVSVHVLAISPECETAFENAECGIALYRIWNRRFDVYAVRISDSHSENKCGNSNSATVSIGNLCFADRLSAKEKITCFAENIAIVSCLVGTFLVATHGSFTSLYISKQGLFWGFLAAVAATLYILIPQQLLADWGSIIPTGIGMLTGGIAFFFIMRVWKISVKLDLTTVVITMLIVLVGTVLAFTMFLKGTSLVGPARGNMLGCVEPLMATVCSAVFLDTVFLPMDIIGFGFIIATVFILAKS